MEKKNGLKRGIEVEFHTFGNLFYGVCRYMPEELRGTLNFEYEEEDGVKYYLKSDKMPKLDDHTLYLWGTRRDCDYYVFNTVYVLEVGAEYVKKQFEKVVESFNKQYCQQEILDKIEKEYLEQIIKPFKNRDVKITKVRHNQVEYINIQYKDMWNRVNDFSLPQFGAQTMYVGMEKNKSYTPKELGLFKEAQA